MKEGKQMTTDDAEGLEGLPKHIRIRLADKAVRKVVAADNHPENFVCADVDGVQHDLNPPGSCYCVTSRPEGALHRINAGYWPDELEEEGFQACRRRRGYDPIEFLVTEAEHARMLRDGVVDFDNGRNVIEDLCMRADRRARLS
jgi:hypothetical protein